jgi:hypothetical protein
VDECADGIDDCDANATCTNSPGSFDCACNAGYAGDGSSCKDVNECAADISLCDQNCTNSEGSFECSCMGGYTLNADGMACDDVDECADGSDNCHANATCTNTAGAFTCACNKGYDGDGKKICTANGDICAAALDAGSVPAKIAGSTVGASPDYGYSSGKCPPEIGGWGGGAGTGANDVVYAFTPDVSGKYNFVLTHSYDGNLYIVTDCDDIDNSCIAGDEDVGSSNAEELNNISLTAGTTYFVIVDGWSNAGANAGNFTLTINLASTTGNGDVCSEAMLVGSLPFTANGNTTDANPDYGYSSGKCPPETGGWGGKAGVGAKDEAYLFIPKDTGSYEITLTHSFDGNLYVVTDCGDINGTCVGGDEDFGSSNAEELTLALEKGVHYYVIVDGYSNTSSFGAGSYTLSIKKL